jgi:hypothetical protein
MEVVWCGYGEPTMRLHTVIDLTKRIRKAILSEEEKRERD